MKKKKILHLNLKFLLNVQINNNKKLNKEKKRRIALHTIYILYLRLCSNLQKKKRN